MGASELSALLWQERELLDVLEFRLEAEQALLAVGKTRWIQRASDEIASITAQLRKLNLVRDVEVAQLADEWGIAADLPSLRQIVGAAPELVWHDIFTAHLTALLTSVDRISTLRDANDHMLRAAIRSTQETLIGPAEAAATYTPRGTTASAQPDARLIDRDA